MLGLELAVCNAVTTRSPQTCMSAQCYKVLFWSLLYRYMMQIKVFTGI